MKHPIVATTTSKYYLDKSMYCVKALKLSKSNKGVYKWHVSKTVFFSKHREDCITVAMNIASKNDLIYVPYATHGKEPSASDISRLELYALLRRQENFTKELPWD